MKFLKGISLVTHALNLLSSLTAAANKIPYFSSSSAASLLDFKDEDNMASDSATAIPSQQSVKAYVDTNAQPVDAELSALAGLTSAANKVPMFSGSGTATVIDFLDEDAMGSDSATAVASQQSIKAYVDSVSLNALLDEDNMASDDATKAPSQQSVKAYVDGQAHMVAETTSEVALPYTIMGSTAYVKWIDLGAMPNATTTNDAHGITGLVTVFDLQIVADNGTNQMCFGSYWTDGSLTLRATVTDTNISITAGGDASGYTQGYARIVYSKA